LENEKLALFIEWSSQGRDFEIDLPLMYFFEKILKWKVQYISIFNLPKILSINPDMVIMSNTTGAGENINISRLIEKSGIPLFSHVSEGMFRENDIEEFVYGWNKKEKRFSETFSTVWSKKAYDMSLMNFPNLYGFYKISGAIGFDKYQLNLKEKIDTKDFKKVIGYAAFDFNNIVSKKEYFIKELGEEKFINFIKISEKINKLLYKLIKNNLDILFLLKPHPGDGEKEPLEFKDLGKFQNTHIVSKEIGIVTTIFNSDIWINYNSSTNLEAWLLNKPSISFNTDEKMFSSDVLYGSILEEDFNKIQKYIDEFYNIGKIEAFEEKKELREKLISEYIGFSDGLNHVRFMSFLKPYIEKMENEKFKKSKWNISLKIQLKGYIRHFLFLISKGKYKIPFLKRWAISYDIFDDKEIYEQKKIRYVDFDKFYQENEKQIDDIYQNWHKNWKQELRIIE
jgi:hypothetical protein